MTTDDELVTRLRSALAAPQVVPDSRAMEGLSRELVAVTSERITHARGAGTITSLRRLAGRRASTFTVILAASLLAGGVAAAAVATDTLPGPARAIAWDLGLPVTSPALHQARQVASDLRISLRARDRRDATSLGRTLERDLKGLDAGDLRQMKGTADQLLEEAGVSGIAGISITPSTTSGGAPAPESGTGGGDGASPSETTTTTLLPDVTVPGVTGSLDLGGTVQGDLPSSSDGS